MSHVELNPASSRRALEHQAGAPQEELGWPHNGVGQGQGPEMEAGLEGAGDRAAPASSRTCHSEDLRGADAGCGGLELTNSE